MVKTVIEELVISLRLDANKLEDSKAIESINSIRQAVKMLDEDLKSVGKSIGGVGNIKFGSGDRTQKAPKSNNFQLGEEWLAAFGGKVVSRTETPAQKVERRRKPIKNFNDILDMMPGFASVVYMAKEIFSLAQKIMGMFGVSNEQARDLKNATARSGLSTELLQTVGLMSQKFGGKKEDTMAGIEKLITGIPVFGKGPIPELLQRTRVSPYDGQGKMRPSDEILKDVMQGVQAYVGKDQKRGAQFANEVGMAPAEINALAQGWDNYLKAQQEYVKKGMLITGTTQEVLNDVALKSRETSAKIDNTKAKISEQNQAIQKIWYDIYSSLWKTAEQLSGNKAGVAGKFFKGPAGLAELGFGALKNMLEETGGMKVFSKAYDSVFMPHAPIQSGQGAGGQLPTSATIIINGEPKSGGTAEIKWNKPGPYRENLVRVQ